MRINPAKRKGLSIMTYHPREKRSTNSKSVRTITSQLYTLKGDIRSLSKTRITARKVLNNLQTQSIILSVDLERQHGNRSTYNGPLHLDLDIYFTSDLPVYRQTRLTKSAQEGYNTTRPHISMLIGLI